MDLLFIIGGFGMVGTIGMVPIVYLFITRKFDRFFPNSEYLVPLPVPLVEQMARGGFYSLCLLFRKISNINPRLRDIVGDFFVNYKPSVTERIIAFLNTAFGFFLLIFFIGYILFPDA